MSENLAEVILRSQSEPFTEDTTNWLIEVPGRPATRDKLPLWRHEFPAFIFVVC